MTTKVMFIQSREQKIPVASWEINIPGLVITEIPVTESIEGYRVTHAASGYAICYASWPTLAIAHLFAKKIENVCDWADSLDNMEQYDKNQKFEIKTKLDKVAEEMQSQMEENPGALIEEALNVERAIKGEEETGIA